MGWHVGSRNRTPSGSVGCTNLAARRGLHGYAVRTTASTRVGSATAAVGRQRVQPVWSPWFNQWGFCLFGFWIPLI